MPILAPTEPDFISRLRFIQMKSVLFFLLLVMIPPLLTSCVPGRARLMESRAQESITSVLTLHTAEYVYREVVYFGEQNSIFGIIPLNDRRILFSVDISVRAGVDLQDRLEVSLTPGRVLNIYLPPGEILYSDVDESTIHQYFIREQGRSISWLEVQDLMGQVKSELEMFALERGIINQAERKARELIRQMLQPMNLEIRFHTRDPLQFERSEPSPGPAPNDGENDGENE